MTYSYISLGELLELHEKVITKSGGLLGIREIGLLESCLELIKNDDYYPTFDEKLTHLIYTIAKNHAFADGNKRSSIGAGAYFLLLNNYPERTSELFVKKMECLVLHVVQNEITKDEMRQILSDYIHSGELSEVSLAIYKSKNLDPNEQPT